MGRIYNSTTNLVAEEGEYFTKALTSGTTTLVKSGNGTLYGILVSSHTSGTIEVRDGLTLATGDIKFGTIALTADASLTSHDRIVHYGGARFSTGIFVYCAGTTNAVALYR
jgi:hypothetical protein